MQLHNVFDPNVRGAVEKWSRVHSVYPVLSLKIEIMDHRVDSWSKKAAAGEKQTICGPWINYITVRWWYACSLESSIFWSFCSVTVSVTFKSSKVHNVILRLFYVHDKIGEMRNIQPNGKSREFSVLILIILKCNHYT